MESNTDNRLCENCGIRPKSLGARRVMRRTGKYKTFYKKKCKTCSKYPNLGDKASQTICRGCNKEFPPVCLDIDHKDGNRKNTSYTNLQILCSNCHRIKSHLCGDHIPKDRK